MLFTDNLFHNNGLDSEEPFDDNGLGLVTNNPRLWKIQNTKFEKY